MSKEFSDKYINFFVKRDQRLGQMIALLVIWHLLLSMYEYLENL